MRVTRRLSSPEVREILRQGGVGILPTDTLYGVVGSAFRKKAVLRIYRLRRRSPKKPMIILIHSLADLKKFGVVVNGQMSNVLQKFWPGKVSVVLPCRSKKFAYLHQGTRTLAFRLPAKKSLRELLRYTGPLVAPSANIEGRPPAKTIRAARTYFGTRVDFYVNSGRLSGQPSTLVALHRGRLTVLRKGAVRMGHIFPAA